MASTVENLRVVGTGEVEGATSATALPSIAARFVTLRAFIGNTGTVYVGLSGVTVPDGTADAVSGYPLAAGEALTLPLLASMDEIYYICSDADQDIHYIAEGPSGG